MYVFISPGLCKIYWDILSTKHATVLMKYSGVYIFQCFVLPCKLVSLVTVDDVTTPQVSQTTTANDHQIKKSEVGKIFEKSSCTFATPLMQIQ